MKIEKGKMVEVRITGPKINDIRYFVNGRKLRGYLYMIKKHFHPFIAVMKVRNLN